MPKTMSRAAIAAAVTAVALVTGFGQRTVLDQRMWNALDGCVARVNAAPPVR